jgi:hypothetical protein
MGEAEDLSYFNSLIELQERRERYSVPPTSLLGSKDVLCFLGSANRASLRASTARNAGICIDLILAVTFGDAAHGASFNASAACYAIVTDLVCHLIFLLINFLDTYIVSQFFVFATVF